MGSAPTALLILHEDPAKGFGFWFYVFGFRVQGFGFKV